MTVKICSRCISRGEILFDPPLVLAPQEELEFKFDKDWNLKVIAKGFPGNRLPVEFEVNLCQKCQAEESAAGGE